MKTWITSNEGADGHTWQWGGGGSGIGQQSSKKTY